MSIAELVTGLDHAVLVCPDIEAGKSAYATLLGARPSWEAAADGAATAVFPVANTALELMAPDGDGPVADRLREILAERGSGLTSLAFRTGDIETAHHRLSRRGLKPGEIAEGESTHAVSGETRTWKRFRCADSEMAGIKTFILQPLTMLKPDTVAPGAATALDHIVINTPNPDRALGLYGARLGLDLALDRTSEEWKTRFLFFRTGGLTLEIIYRLGERHDPDAPDQIWGLTWAVNNLPAAHARLAAAGISISEIRKGRKPGSAVFTVRDGTLGVPTLFISHTPR